MTTWGKVGSMGVEAALLLFVLTAMRTVVYALRRLLPRRMRGRGAMPFMLVHIFIFYCYFDLNERIIRDQVDRVLSRRAVVVSIGGGSTRGREDGPGSGVGGANPQRGRRPPREGKQERTGTDRGGRSRGTHG